MTYKTSSFDFKSLLLHLDEKDKLSQGAEAVIYKVSTQNGIFLIKHRFAKSYREPTLDKTMNKKRVSNENKTLQRFNELNIPCPKIFYCNNLDIVMEYIDGKTLKSFVNDMYKNEKYSDEAICVMGKLGQLIGTIHKKGFIHGDLTTSNFMITQTGDIIIIDFGLTTMSETIENRAVDLYVLERALLCTHYKAEDLFRYILEGYRETGDKANEVIQHLNEVRLRGRKKDMSG
ncbi:hypothetical protein ENUP19_0052G0053 [Entamoeba nuttalli]|uniref:non-specific serine/threonine protein kinase n=1 Tax=Entamoeba nuttalli TaxID=412467 RepID=A0ABQ0DC22_9EUKA